MTPNFFFTIRFQNELWEFECRILAGNRFSATIMEKVDTLNIGTMIFWTSEAFTGVTWEAPEDATKRAFLRAVAHELTKRLIGANII